MPRTERWRSRLRTAAAMTALGWARLVVAAMPFERWRTSLGGEAGKLAREPRPKEARRLAAQVEWAAKLLPLPTKCLPRAMALSWILRRKRIGHVVVFAVRPTQMRGSKDDLHAWIEVAGEAVLGDLPGPWIETLRLGHETVHREKKSD